MIKVKLFLVCVFLLVSNINVLAHDDTAVREVRFYLKVCLDISDTSEGKYKVIKVVVNPDSNTEYDERTKLRFVRRVATVFEQLLRDRGWLRARKNNRRRFRDGESNQQKILEKQKIDIVLNTRLWKQFKKKQILERQSTHIYLNPNVKQFGNGRVTTDIFSNITPIHRYFTNYQKGGNISTGNQALKFYLTGIINGFECALPECYRWNPSKRKKTRIKY